VNAITLSISVDR